MNKLEDLIERIKIVPHKITTRLEAKLSNNFSSKKEQEQYLKDKGCTNVEYSGRTKAFYYNI